MSNDGWFARSAEQQQHLAVSLFRAVECRTPLVRASNTGVSAVIDGDGRVRDPAIYLDETGNERPGTATPDETACVLIADVPLDPAGQRVFSRRRLARRPLPAGRGVRVALNVRKK